MVVADAAVVAATEPRNGMHAGSDRGGMTKWEQHRKQARVEAALDEQLYLTAYQLAIKLERAHPGLAESLGKPVGGAGVGSPDSVAQYLANQLVTRSSDPGSRVEVAFLSNDEVRDIRFAHPDGSDLVSSLTGTGYPLSLFRLRAGDHV